MEESGKAEVDEPDGPIRRPVLSIRREANNAVIFSSPATTFGLVRSLVGQDNVLGLDVKMTEAELVKMVQTFEELPDDVSNVGLRVALAPHEAAEQTAASAQLCRGMDISKKIQKQYKRLVQPSDLSSTLCLTRGKEHPCVGNEHVPQPQDVRVRAGGRPHHHLAVEHAAVLVESLGLDHLRTVREGRKARFHL